MARKFLVWYLVQLHCAPIFHAHPLLFSGLACILLLSLGLLRSIPGGVSTTTVRRHVIHRKSGRRFCGEPSVARYRNMSDNEFIEHADAPLSPRSHPPLDDDFTEFVENAEPMHPGGYEHHEHNDPHHTEDIHHTENVDHRENAPQQHGENHADHPDSGHSEHHEGGSAPLRPSLSRRSTIMLNEEELNQVNYPEEVHEEGPLSRAQEGEQVDLNQISATQPKDGLVETVIEWKEGGSSVFVTGSFTGWRQMIPLRKFDDNVFVVVLKLAPGTHRLRFVVDGELRCSDDMNAATDSMGNLVNYMEVPYPESTQAEDHFFENEDQEPKHQYTREIPEIFADPEALDRFSSIEFTPPPQLPPHLDGVILNTNWTEKDNNSVLPIPNHVVLNHLATTSIKHNVLAVASVSRYQAKYVTQILYSPIEGI